MLYIFVYVILTYFFFVSTRKNIKMSKGSFMAILTILALIVGLGDMLGGYDRYIYSELFDRGADIYNNGQRYFIDDNPIMGYKSEYLYVVWNYIVAHVTSNRYIFILLTTLCVYILLYLSFSNYIDNYPFFLILFMGFWFFFTFTYLRQVMAASVAWLGYRYVADRKLLKFLLVAIVAYFFHNSAIVFLSLYFLNRKRPSRQLIIFIMIICMILGLLGIPSVFYGAYGDTIDQARVRGYDKEAYTFRYEYIVEAWFFLYIILYNYHRFSKDRLTNVMLTASFLFCAFLLLYIRNSNGGRLSWYFILGPLTLLCNLISSNMISSREVKRLISLVYIVTTLLFIRFIYSWSDMISPYKSFLTNGHRSNDMTFYKFEYDERYDKDKFYRRTFVLFKSHDNNSNSNVQ